MLPSLKTQYFYLVDQKPHRQEAWPIHFLKIQLDHVDSLTQPFFWHQVSLTHGHIIVGLIDEGKDFGYYSFSSASFMHATLQLCWSLCCFSTHTTHIPISKTWYSLLPAWEARESHMTHFFSPRSLFKCAHVTKAFPNYFLWSAFSVISVFSPWFSLLQSILL